MINCYSIIKSIARRWFMCHFQLLLAFTFIGLLQLRSGVLTHTTLRYTMSDIHYLTKGCAFCELHYLLPFDDVSTIYLFTSSVTKTILDVRNSLCITVSLFF